MDPTTHGQFDEDATAQARGDAVIPEGCVALGGEAQLALEGKLAGE